jgi:hypothetical protein
MAEAKIGLMHQEAKEPYGLLTAIRSQEKTREDSTQILRV